MSFVPRMQTPDDIVQLFDEYSVEGCDGELTAAPAKVGGGIQQKVGGDPRDLQHTKVQDDKRIGFVELRKSTTGAEELAAQNQVIDAIVAKKGQITEEDFPEIARQKSEISKRFGPTESRRGKSTLKTILHAAATAESVPCYYLPWNPTGGAVELKIPDRGGGAVAADNPILFLTAALSGCSIYVKGPANSPTIWHCGTNADTTGKSAASFWNGVMAQIGEDVDELGAIHNRDYMVPMRGEKAELKEAEKREKALGKDLKSRFKKALEVENVRTWGAVFGVRRGGNWTFYMQENCTVTYHKITKKGQKPETRIYSRPAFCSEIFPTGGAKARCFQHLRALKA